jgi:hypothetical protein
MGTIVERAVFRLHDLYMISCLVICQLIGPPAMMKI